jgi:hypothetical protein
VPGTTISVHINAGEWIAVGTCGVVGARVGGDTVLRLRDPDGVEIAYSDDACGGLGSRISFRATRTGAHQIVLACYSGEGCGGRVAWQVDDEEVRMPFATWDLGLDLRALLGPAGQGLVADAWIRARLDGLGGMVLSLGRAHGDCRRHRRRRARRGRAPRRGLGHRLRRGRHRRRREHLVASR